ncbi:hypothetical protein [Actinoallomurus acaciae]|uniref:Uncharacterized protein n=1 Tax=Actinoallomurus acaciae TaxID=502577 RepID=A0ABV5Z0G7_9ACTN
MIAVVRSLKRRRSGGEELLAYRSGQRRHNVTAADINDHLRELSSYIDPRIIELYEQGVTIEPALADLGKGRDLGELATRGPAEKAVLTILTGHAGSR